MSSLLSYTWSGANEVVSGENSPLPLFSVTKHDPRLQITRGPSAARAQEPPPLPGQNRQASHPLALGWGPGWGPGGSGSCRVQV